MYVEISSDDVPRAFGNEFHLITQTTSVYSKSITIANTYSSHKHEVQAYPSWYRPLDGPMVHHLKSNCFSIHSIPSDHPAPNLPPSQWVMRSFTNWIGSSAMRSIAAIGLGYRGKTCLTFTLTCLSKSHMCRVSLMIYLSAKVHLFETRANKGVSLCTLRLWPSGGTVLGLLNLRCNGLGRGLDASCVSSSEAL